MVFVKEWKNVAGYEKFYKVSNYGEVKVKRRVVYRMIDGEMQPICVTKEKILHPFDNGAGYLVISLVGDDKHKKNFYVHRLVADAFLPNPDNLPQVDHLDYDRKNNRVTNLRWVTASENVIHSRCNLPKIKRYCNSSTGYKYIYRRGESFRVGMPGVDGTTVDKRFHTLEEAIAYRNHVAEETGIECIDNIN